MAVKRNVYGIGLAVILVLVALITLSCGELDDAFEITIAGKVTLTNTTTGVPDIFIGVTGDMVGSSNTDSLGAFSFGGLTSGTYTIQPHSTEYTFVPDQYIVITESSVLDVDFVATAVTP